MCHHSDRFTHLKKLKLNFKIFTLVDSSQCYSIFVAFLIFYYFIYFSAVSMLSHDTFGTSAYDVGLFDQAIWLLSRGISPFTTIKGVHIWGDHASFGQLFLVPFMRFFNSVNVLYIGQTAFLVLAVIPLFLLARKQVSGFFSAILCFSYLFNPSLQNMNLENFHPETFVVLPLTWALYFLEEEKMLASAICCAFAMIGKEDVSISLFFFGVSLTFFKGKRQWGARIAFMAAIWYLLATRVLMPYFNGLHIFNNQPLVYSFWFSGVLGKITNPSKLLSLITDPVSLKYYFQLGLPMAFLCYLSPRYLMFVLPAIFINVVSETDYLRSIRYHYNYVTLPFLHVGAIAGMVTLLKHFLQTNHRKTAARFGLALVVLTCSLVANLSLSQRPFSTQWSQLMGLLNFREEKKIEEMKAALNLIPENATVSASHNLIPHLTHRREIYMFPNPFILTLWNMHFKQGKDPRLNGRDIDYLILDTSLPPNKEIGILERYLLTSGKYSKISTGDRVVVLKRKPWIMAAEKNIHYELISKNEKREGYLPTTYLPMNLYYLREVFYGVLHEGPAILRLKGNFLVDHPGIFSFNISTSNEGYFHIAESHVNFSNTSVLHSLALKAGSHPFEILLRAEKAPFGFMATWRDSHNEDNIL